MKIEKVYKIIGFVSTNLQLFLQNKWMYNTKHMLKHTLNLVPQAKTLILCMFVCEDTLSLGINIQSNHFSSG